MNNYIMKKYIIAILLLTAGLLPVKGDNITVDGTSRSYIVYAPKNLGQNRPLFIFCHGASQDANYMLNTQFRDTGKGISIENVCDTAKFVMVFPDGIDRMWDVGGNRDINFVKALIDKMVTQYKIDRNRVYLGGFSMGGMFTYHAMNKIPDLIAAFVPVSGYPMGGATANSNVRPLPIMHIHGTADDVCVFSGVQPALNVWINHNGCPTSAKVANNYNGFSGAKLHTWAPGKDGVEVMLLELPNKGHWVCKEPQVYTGKEMWNFCKRYSLNFTAPSVSFTSPYPGTTHLYFSPSSNITLPDIQLTAKASDPNGKVVQVDFYDGTELIATLDKAPYTFTVQNPVAGKHVFKAVATDNDGETAEATVTVNYSVGRSYMFHNDFKEGGSIPLGWTTYDGSERRNGFSNGYSSGSRVLQFTSTTRDFDYGLYFRNQNGKQQVGYAKYGLEAAHSMLTLCPGNYMLRYKICNWNNDEKAPVTICIEKKKDGKAIASTTYTPTVNIGNDASKSFKSTRITSFEFTVEEEGDYLLSFYAADQEWGDGVIGYLMLAAKEYTPTGIEEQMVNGKWSNRKSIHNISGQRMNGLQRGFNIVGGKKIYVK